MRGLLFDIVGVSGFDCVPEDGFFEGVSEGVVGVAFVVHEDYAINDDSKSNCLCFRADKVDFMGLMLLFDEKMIILSEIIFGYGLLRNWIL